jgi:signal transduction histidine kinase
MASEPGRPPRWHESVFVKLVAIMLATGVILLVMVVFFWLMMSPSLSLGRFAKEYTRVLAATSPDLETAKRLASRFDLQIRYEGPDGGWTTSPDLPSIQEAAAGDEIHGQGGAMGGHDLYVLPGKSGHYLFVWDIRRRMSAFHNGLLGLLLLFVCTVVFAAHAFLRRALRPLRVLQDGVARLGEGQLDVVLPSRTRDEFGALTDAFNQMVRRIRDMLQARDQLLLDVSHELRSPLTRMKVALELLPEGEKRRSIAADVAEMEAMITELLELERLRDGRGLRAERQDLLPILREVVDSFQDRVPGVRIESAAKEILLDLDADKMRTVLRNLLENAIKYSLPDSGPVEVHAGEDGPTAVVRVVDDGPGIPETELSRLFEPFFRVDRSRSKKTGGYGLGLSICKRIVEAHGGGITAENNAPRGACFTLSLPKPA